MVNDDQHPHDRLRSALAEQISFIRLSGAAFDQGLHHEAKRIAAAGRVLLHDTRQSESVLGQLGIKDRIGFLDTLMPPPPSDVVTMRSWPSGMVSVVMDGGGTRYTPMLGEVFEMTHVSPWVLPGSWPSEKLFDAWWNMPVVYGLTEPGEVWSRRDLVLGAAHHEGGAHVDPNPKPAWLLLRDESFSGAGHGMDAMGQPSPLGLPWALLRQIGFELDVTLSKWIGRPQEA